MRTRSARSESSQRATHTLEPLEDRYLMSAAAVKFAPVYAQLGNGQTVRLGYIQYHNTLDLQAAAAAAANATAAGGDGSSTIWKPSITADGLILLTPVFRDAHSGSAGRGGSSSSADP